MSEAAEEPTLHHARPSDGQLGEVPAQLLQRDVVWSLLTLALSSSLLRKVPLAGQGPALPALVGAVVATCLLVVWLARCRPSWYSRHRNVLLLTTRAGRVFCIMQIHRWAPNLNLNEELPQGLLPALVRLSTRGIFLGASALGFRLPLRWHLPTQLASWALLLAMLPARCNIECAVPNQAERYARMATWLRWLADLVWLGLPAPLRPRCHCFLVAAWLDTFLGLLLPTWLLVRADAAVESPEGREMARLTAAACHPGVLLASAALAWRLVEAVALLAFSP